MPDLAEVLERLGLTAYHDALAANGFHDWETVIDITEEDLTSLQFKRGHRRALQREIATFRGIPSSTALVDPDAAMPDPTSLSTAALESLSRQDATAPASAEREKRRYRRHPRPDVNAPKKPKTAYVNFADQLRADPDISALSFVDIAKEVGRRWQVLPAEKKRVWEGQAARALQEYEAQMDEYKQTDNWRKYQAYLAEFKATHQSQSSPAKRPTSSRLSSFQTEYSRASPSSTDSPLPMTPSSLSSPEAELCHNALTLAFSELVSLRGKTLGHDHQLYDAKHLPAEGLVRRAMNAFVQGSGSLLFVWTHGQVDEILDLVYRPGRQQADAMTLAECFTIAALGAHYDLECCPEATRRLLYASGSLHFNEKTARVDYLRTMRLLLSLSFYALLEKHMSARNLVAAALQIARWKCLPLQHTGSEEALGGWRRVFRSIILVDCWLSYTLGYPSDVTANDISVACTIHGTSLPNPDQLIQIQASKVALIAAEMVKTFDSAEPVTRNRAQFLTRKLDLWQAEVPLLLQLSNLTSSSPPELTAYQRRAALKVHIMYLGARMLLHRFLLNQPDSTVDMKLYMDESNEAAQQIARILGVMSVDGIVETRCWIIIYWAFTACITLLLSASNKLLSGSPETANGDLTSAKTCIDMLEPCHRHDSMADRYLDTTWPLYDYLRDIHQRAVGRAKTSIFSLLQADPNQISPPIPVSPEELGPLSRKLTLLFLDPFGRKGLDDKLRAVKQEGPREAFWWK